MAQRPAATNLNYTSGDDLSLQFTVTLNDAVVDITGMTVSFVVARNHTATPVISTATSPQTATYDLTTPASGIFTVTVDSLVTDALSGTYIYECEVTDGSGDSSTVAHGVITFAPNLI